MKFSKEEIKWADQEKKEFLRIGNILEELNRRTRSYVGMQGRTVQEAQQQALIDWQGFYKPGEFVPTTDKRDFDNFVYFQVQQ